MSSDGGTCTDCGATRFTDGLDWLCNDCREKRRNGPCYAATKVGRNELCPCGSGYKYKKCHGRLDAQRHVHDPESPQAPAAGG